MYSNTQRTFGDTASATTPSGKGRNLQRSPSYISTGLQEKQSHKKVINRLLSADVDFEECHSPHTLDSNWKSSPSRSLEVLTRDDRDEKTL